MTNSTAHLITPRIAEQKHWPQQAAAHRLTTRVPMVSDSATVAQAEALIKKHARSFDTIHYLYAVNETGRLMGVLSLRDMYRHLPETLIKDAAVTAGLVAVRPEERQDKVAYLALKHDLKAIPVVDKDRTFLGVVPGDAILKILYRDTRRDLLRLANIHSGAEPFDNVLTASVGRLLRHRVPWLLLGLLGGLVSVRIISGFEETLAANVVLAAFVPLVVYMSDAIKTQMEIFVIRDIAVEHKLPFGRYFTKQGFVTLCLSAVFGTVLFLFALALYQDLALSLAVALALSIAILSSIVTGLVVPYLFSRTKFDPANTSGPIATVIQDIISISIYFAVAARLLS
ncbi:MAG: Mg2+ transporter [Candidatus Magasanikbacteria bacterium GW2011_GWA2_56_11]|uniref:Mg2+ transporter n=1 Tax=Candidatus Magasanikbacteria bacterium GW2011_GWA2_56_11 TaxID=1619044 RepID=A0A0G2B8Z3_9BACT|nr:MAG: Mg2+ transporter [Candidatus Magasanikbacteria bacterium GW2011_GWA2_56_11]